MTEKKSIEKIEKEYVIPLRAKVMKVPRYKRAKKAIRTIREFLVQHMQIRNRDLNKVRLDKYLNQMIWSRGIQKPPHKIKVKAIKEGDIVRVEAYELSKKIGFQKQREEKRDKKHSEQDKKESKVEKTESKKDEEVKAEDKIKEEETEEKKKNTIKAEQKYEKQKAKERKHESGGAGKMPIQKKKEHSKGSGTGR